MYNVPGIVSGVVGAVCKSYERPPLLQERRRLFRSGAIVLTGFGRDNTSRASLGLHPQLVAERTNELPIWEEYLPGTRYVGEVGLDAGPRFYRSFDIQKQVFERILRACARAGGKILTIHSVRATAAVLDMIESHLPASRGKTVLHWFTGTKAETREPS